MSAAKKLLSMRVQSWLKCIHLPYDGMLIATLAPIVNGYHLYSSIPWIYHMPCAPWLEACTLVCHFSCSLRKQSLATKSAFPEYSSHTSRSWEASLDDLHEWLQYPVASGVHGSEVDSEQPVDEVGIWCVIRSDTHSPLEHPCCTQTWVVGIDGRQCLLVQSFCLYSSQFVSMQTLMAMTE